MKLREVLKCLWIIPVYIYVHIVEILGEHTGESVNSVSDYIINDVFGVQTLYEKKQLILAVDFLFVVVLFNLLFGSYIYRYFIRNTLAYFSRVRERERWLKIKSIELYGYCFCYVALYILLEILFLFYKYEKVPFTMEDARVVFIMILVTTFIIGGTTLAINGIAIKIGSKVAFVSCYIVMLILLGISMNFSDIVQNEKFQFLNLFNPMSAMTVGNVDSKLQQLLVLVYYIALTFGGCTVIAKGVKKMDIYGKNKEVM